ncbi:MAG: radical SAM protein [Sedimentibacter sp.]|uniref:B12-binding domain-containing radical SAM protein n=1 Tax=Sedimentibacter sp. TaxID=1960295 RepID=UPI003158DE9D
MIVFLNKVRVKTVFSAFEPVVTEPLELCYLKAVLNSMSVENYLIDELLGLTQPKDITPDIVVLTGYNVAEQEIIREAHLYKMKYPHVKIIVGGVHIQGNSHDFHVKDIDYVCHTQSLNTFKLLIEKIISMDEKTAIDGVDFLINGEESAEAYWSIGKKEIIYGNENILADRSIFKQKSNKLHYLEKKNVALIKSSIGCPFNCSYCYCRQLNSNHYVKADYAEMVHEMESIEADYFWIVDDVLFSQRSDALEFIDIVRSRNVKLKIIGYLRADFILREKDLLGKLKGAGLTEVIVGFEATNNDELKGYEKTTNALDYPKVISLLKEHGIHLTALFMVQPDYGTGDFKNLNKFVKQNNIDVFTVSILTPVKSTEDYELLKNDLITKNPEKFDFLHLVLKPKLPKWLFYALFYGIHLQLLTSKRVWKYILNK